MILRTPYRIIPVALAGIVVAGCASTVQQAPPPDGATGTRPLGSQYISAGQERPAPSNGQCRTPTGPTGTLQLEQALALAMLKNPELAAFSYEVRAAEARTRQARAFPNPEIELEVEEYDRGGEGFDSAETAIVLAQRFELGGKRRSRIRMAKAEGELACWDYERKRLEVFSRTGQRFVAVIAAQLRLDLAKSTVKLAEETSRAVRERVNAGKEPPLQASKAAAELELVRLGVCEARSSLNVERVKLAAMWGVMQPQFEVVQGDLDDILESIPSMDALCSPLSGNPDLARWDAELRLREASLSAEKAARMPDLEASVGLLRYEEDGTDALAFGIGAPLPLFDRNKGNISAARHELAKAAAERQASETALSAELAEAHADLSSAHQRVVAIRTKVIPAMEEAFESSHAGYKQGKFGFLDMLDAQRGLFEARGALVDALSAYHFAVGTIQRITGTGIEELTSIEEEKQQ